MALYGYYGLHMAPGLHREWEGLWLDLNFRDVGVSLNGCLAHKLEPPRFRGDILLRSNKWFSGWSCQNVNNPERIFSLNATAATGHQYYCRRSDGSIRLAHSFQDEELRDIEFIENWQDASSQRNAVCRTVEAILAGEGSSDFPTLLHCEAGRDRTGAVVALLAAAAMEHKGFTTSEINELVECDYQKSASLHPDKYGRMERWILDITERDNSITLFLQQQCQITEQMIYKFADQWLY